MVDAGSAVLMGFLSFVSPCFLPILPGFLSFIAGMSVLEIHSEGGEDRRALANLVFRVAVFVVGFSAIFTIMGASATAVGQALRSHQDLLRIVAGGVLGLLGLQMTGLIKIPFLLTERKFQVGRKRSGLVWILFAGGLFGIAWSPCIGPLLAGVLALASQKETVRQGVILLLLFSAGLGVPLLLSAVFFRRFLGFFRKAKGYLRAVEIGSGILLLLFGALLVTNQFGRISSKLEFLNSVVERFNPGLAAGPEGADGTAAVRKEKFDLSQTFYTLEGQAVRASDLAGRLTLFNFFATWCGPCRLETPELVKLYEKYRERGFSVVAIAEDSEMEEIENFIEEFDISYPVVVDKEGKVGDKLGLIGLPASYLVDEKGTILRLWPGQVRENDLERAIEKALPRGEPPPAGLIPTSQ